MKRSRRRKHNRGRKKVDRLSSLPDCLLLDILSFLDTKLAVQTLILSKRWKNIWKRLSNLTLIPCTYFRNTEGFVSHFLSLRDSSTSLHVLNCVRDDIADPHLLNRMVNYAVSHNVQQLHISVDSLSILPIVENFLPPTLFSCQTLTSLNLSVYYPQFWGTKTILYPFPNSLDLPELISLYLKSFSFLAGDDGCTEPFSALSKLKSLIINECEVLSRHNRKLCISSNTLVNLTIIMPWTRSYRDKPNFGIELSTPSLCTFDFIGIPIQKLCGSLSNLSSVKHVNIDADCESKFDKTPSVLLNWLIELPNTESMTVSLGTLQVLSFVPDLIKVEFPSLYNLKSLKVIKKGYYSHPFKPKEIVNFLLQNAPSAKVDILLKP